MPIHQLRTILLAVLLVFCGQPKTPQAGSALDAAIVFCQAGHAAGGQPVLPHHVHEAAAPIASAAALQACTLPAMPLPAALPSIRGRVAFSLLPARAPPGLRATGASARGPPRSV